MKSDLELIRAYLRGNEAAFQTFYERHRRPLYVYLLSFVRFRETAEELMQETFYSFLRHLEHVEPCADYRPYLMRTARNRAIDFLRREQRGVRAVENRRRDPMFQGAASPVFSTRPDPEAAELESLLDRLPVEQKETVVLRALGGLTFQAIARLTGVPENTAISRYRYGLQKLRTALEAGGCGERSR